MAKFPFLNWLILCALVVAWGSSFAMTKIAVTHLDSAWIMALRLLVASLVLVPYALFQGQSLNLPAQSWKKFSALGFIGHAAPFFLITWGTQFVASGISGLLMGAIPLFLVVLAHFFLPNEQLTFPKALGFLSGFAGIITLVGPNTIFTLAGRDNAMLGETAILLGCLCYAVHGVMAKRMGFTNPVLQTSAVTLAAAIMGIIFASLVSEQDPTSAPASALWSVVALGVLPTAIASLLMYTLIQRAGPSFVAYSNYLVPVYALLLGAAVMNETLSWNVALALAFILGGIAISQMKSFKLQPSK